MPLSAVAVALMAVYITLTAGAPFVLSRPRLLMWHPRLSLRLWMLTFWVAAASITVALGIFITLALRHHVVHAAGHDALGPLVDQLLGWLAIAVVGILAFRMGVAVQDARAAVADLSGEFAPLLASASRLRVSDHTVFVVDSSVPLMGAHAGQVVATSAMVNSLTEKELAIVVEHEHAHNVLRHARVLAIANVAEAVAPAIRAGAGFASAARITTELIADDFAANRYGRGATAQALVAAYPEATGLTERVQRLRNNVAV